VLLFANYLFYARWSLLYLLLIPAASSCDFAIGLALQKYRNRVLRRVLVGCSLGLNLGLLVTLKYVPTVSSHWPGQSAPRWSWSLPLALSFYAFQALTYTIDLYRKDEKGTSSYLAHLTAVSFFPTILAGPITHVADLIKQLERNKTGLLPGVSGRAMFLIGLGLVKKLLIADYLAENLVNRVFDLPRLYTGLEVLAGVYGYALQLYCDFSGYTDIAIGSALLLGVKLPENFNRPYAAVSITDFWRRWHISFSNWLRDYLYFSLPGLRSKWKIFTYTNLVITMLLGGLWHGLSWTFAIWGLLHGVGLALSHAWRRWRGPAPAKPSVAGRWVATFLTVQFVCFAWIFFRAPSIEAAVAILGRIASLTVSFENISLGFAAVLIGTALAHFVPERWIRKAEETFAASPFYVQAAALALLVVAIQLMAGRGAAPFVYSKF
jgi:D-alanyl-lipoteichoic acid acyltransferase DltB (MBOAT superfamily)